MRAFAPIYFVFFAVAASAAVQRAEIDFEFVRELATKRSAERYRPPDERVPPRIAALTYDDYRKIEFRPDRALWRDGLPFQLQLLPRGGLFRQGVTLHEFSRSHVQKIPFDADHFEVKEIPDLPSLPGNLGYAGFKLFHPLTAPDAFNEVASFVGASYFRALGAEQHYGLSARGIALDSGVAGRREEFPHFSEFWLGKPEKGAPDVTLFALMEGPSVTGAFEFIITPGKATFIDVRAALIFRSDDKLPGFAPLTSMFWYGENTRRPVGEMRPEVHDSDGLIVREEDGEQIWRPLRNPPRPEATHIPVRSLSRFGLAQRDRRLHNFEDLEAQYERRPSAWIEPRDGFGNGTVRLLELPATTEYADNIVAYWVPEEGPRPGRALELRYRVVWASNEPSDGPPAHVVATREGARPAGAKGPFFWVDFVDANAADRVASAVVAEVEVGPGATLVHQRVQPYPEIGGWRVAIEVEPPESSRDGVELRCRLRDNDGVISEQWLYQWKP